MAANVEPSGTLIYRIDLQNSILFVLESEFGEDTKLRITDAATAAEFSLHLPSQHAALAIIDKQTKQIVAKYGLP